MVPHSHLPTNHSVVLNNRASANARLGCNYNAFAYVYVVCDLDHVVDFRSSPNARNTKGRPINAGICADFHIIFNNYCSDLWEFDVSIRPAHVPEPIRANHCSGMNNHAISNGYTVVDHNTGMDHAILTNRNTIAYKT